MQGQPGSRLLHVAELLTRAAALRDEAEYTACVARAVATLPLLSLVQNGTHHATGTSHVGAAAAACGALHAQVQPSGACSAPDSPSKGVIPRLQILVALGISRWLVFMFKAQNSSLPVGASNLQQNAAFLEHVRTDDADSLYWISI